MIKKLAWLAALKRHGLRILALQLVVLGLLGLGPMGLGSLGGSKAIAETLASASESRPVTDAHPNPVTGLRPSIVVIMADDMGYSDLGCYGGEIETPHIDNLAENGVRFTQFYNTGRCFSTRASLLSGLHPHQTGIGHMIELGIVQERWGLAPRDAREWDTLDAAQQIEMDLRMAIYAAQVDRMDQNIGRLVAALKSSGQLSNTLILFLSDNGGCAEGGELGSGDAELLGTQQGLYLSYGRAWELYDLASDRIEQHDLAAEQPQRVGEMVNRWETWARRCHVIPDPRGKKNKVAADRPT